MGRAARRLMGLRPPEDDLAGFPSAESPTELYRLAFHRDRSGAIAPAWRFASVPPGENRFDLPLPHGTCSWSDRRYGALVEVLRGRLVATEDLRRRRLFIAQAPPLVLADLTARRAYRHGMTSEIWAVADYSLPQQWADALHRAGFAGVQALCRHDPSALARNIGVFGRGGRPARQLGWHVRRTRAELDLVLRREAQALGVSIQDIPVDVPVSRPDVD